MTHMLFRWFACFCLAAVLAVAPAGGLAQDKVPVEDDGWIALTDGKTMEGWKINENPQSWQVKDSVFVAKGPRSHLFYVGPHAPFQNFEFQCEVMTKPGANGGIYFHTKFQESGWPKAGFEVQVNNTHRDPRKTGSLYAVKDVRQAPAKDNQWFTVWFRVKDKSAVVKIDGKTVVEYTEPPGAKPSSPQFDRVFGSGTFAFQAHDPQSEVHFRNVKVRKLPE